MCGRHSVACMISARVAPLARFIKAITSAFLLERSAVGLGVFGGFAFFVALVLAFGFSGGGA